MRISVSRFVAPMALLSMAAFSPAVILISNMPGNDATQTAGISTLRGKGMAFTTSAGTPYNITGIDVRLNIITPATTNPLLTLHADNAGNPGALLTTFTDPVFTTPGIATYTFGASFALAANTKYWLRMFGEAGGAAFDWKASTPAQTPTGIFTHTGSLFTTNSGTTWTTSATMTSYSLHGEAVPEPVTLAAVGVGILALRQRRRV